MTAPSVAALLREAARAHQLGQPAETARFARMALDQDPRNFDALYLQALATMQQGRVDEAEELAGRAVKRNPASADALMLLGSILLMRKRPDEALALFDRAVVAQPKNIDARYNRAVVLSQIGRLPQALAGYDQVLAAQPAFSAAWFNRGSILVQLGRLEDALQSFDRVLALTPGNPDALNNRGNTLAMLGRHEAAVQNFDQLLALNSRHVDALTNRATSLKALGRLDEALASAGQALAIQPDHVSALVTRGNILHAMARYDDAVASYERALALAPDDIDIIVNRGISFLEMGRFEEALANAERAVAIAPHDANAYVSRAKALQALARHEEAIRDYQNALALKPDIADAQHNLATCNLCLGRFDQGWAKYIPQGRRNGHPLSLHPRWDGSHVPGTLLVWCDEGVGDQIIYASIVPELGDAAGRVVLAVDHRLAPLFARSFPDFSVVNAGSAAEFAGQFDVQTETSGLAQHLRKSFESFPQRDRGYLVADPERVRQLRERLADGRRVIGLSWISKNPDSGRFKGCKLTDFEALQRLPGCRFVDLQYGDTDVERTSAERELGVKIERIRDIDATNDLDGLAALVSACDAVVTVSNTTAHLAGALGVPTFVVVAFGRGRIWYWFSDRPSSPWYPRVQVRHKEKGQSWAEAIAAVTTEVAKGFTS